MQVLKRPTRWSQWEEDDDELPELPWKKVTSCAAPPGLDDENHAQAAYQYWVTPRVRSINYKTSGAVLDPVCDDRSILDLVAIQVDTVRPYVFV